MDSPVRGIPDDRQVGEKFNSVIKRPGGEPYHRRPSLARNPFPGYRDFSFSINPLQIGLRGLAQNVRWKTNDRATRQRIDQRAIVNAPPP